MASVIPELKKHIDKYCWIKCTWGFAYEYTLEIAIKEMNHLLEKNLDELEKQKNDLLVNNEYRKNKLLSKYRFNENINALIKLVPFFTYWQDLRKENSLMFVYAESKLLKEFSGRYGVDFKDLHLFDIKEIEHVLKNKEKLNSELEKRRSNFLIAYSKEGSSFVFGDKVKEYFSKITHVDKTDGEIKGVCASVGKAQGKAKIIHTLDEFSKFEQGDILITGMTRPEFVPLMKKASAIVTDNGGITCHAAIVSRELEKPCVIGTRIATKVLKDGDIVEVDANEGVVRRIK